VDPFQILPALTAALGAILSLSAREAVRSRGEAERKRRDAELRKIEAAVSEEPQKLRPAWDLARLKLEEYFDKNLAQVSHIFYVGLLVLVFGFIFIAAGVGLAVANPQNIRMSAIAAGAGVITEFVGATFMVIYKSTLQQASTYMSILDRINSVGMAVQIVDSISEEDVGLKNATRAELVKLLLTPVNSTSSPSKPITQRSRAPKKLKNAGVEEAEA
jgi:hypothetical protein